MLQEATGRGTDRRKKKKGGGTGRTHTLFKTVISGRDPVSTIPDHNHIQLNVTAYFYIVGFCPPPKHYYSLHNQTNLKIMATYNYSFCA